MAFTTRSAVLKKKSSARDLSSRTLQLPALRQAYLARYKEEPQIAVETRSWIAAAHLSKEGMGIAYVPDYVAAAETLIAT